MKGLHEYKVDFYNFSAMTEYLYIGFDFITQGSGGEPKIVDKIFMTENDSR